MVALFIFDAVSGLIFQHIPGVSRFCCLRLPNSATIASSTPLLPFMPTASRKNVTSFYLQGTKKQGIDKGIVKPEGK